MINKLMPALYALKLLPLATNGVTTNTNQTITGNKTFDGITTYNNEYRYSISSSLFRLSSAPFTANFNLTSGTIYIVDATAGDITITLATSLTNGREVDIVRIDNSGNTVTVVLTAGTLLGGPTLPVLSRRTLRGLTSSRTIMT
jgi:hypothetical protein